MGEEKYWSGVNSSAPAGVSNSCSTSGTHHTTLVTRWWMMKGPGSAYEKWNISFSVRYQIWFSTIWNCHHRDICFSFFSLKPKCWVARFHPLQMSSKEYKN
jgi:hypothetical protein